MITSQDLAILCCPGCRGDLILSQDNLTCVQCHSAYPITDGIPRLLKPDFKYNRTWDYKWTVLDQGRGYNYQILEKGSPAYQIHNVFQFFENEDSLFQNLGDGVAADVGCGIGQYSISLLEKGVRKAYALDLTHGVDIGQKIVAARYPQYRERIVFIQADARHLPIKSGRMDLAMALASIHHSGYLDECVSEVVRITRPGSRFFIWIYAKPLIPSGDKSRNLKGWARLTLYLMHYSYIELIYNVIKRMPESVRVRILKFFASDAVYSFRHIPFFGRWITYATPGINEHPDRGYRLINLYDAYSPAFAEASDEGHVIGWSKKFQFRILSFSLWRLGFVGLKSVPPAFPARLIE